MLSMVAMASAAPDEGPVPAFIEFPKPLDEEDRKAIAQYAYQVDRGIGDVEFDEQRLVVRTRDGSDIDDKTRLLILAFAAELAAKPSALDARVLRERTAARHVGGQPVADLRRSGLLLHEGPGLVALRGEALAFRRALDAQLRGHALARGAIEDEYPPLLELAALAQSGYVGNFPQHVFFLSEVDRDTAALDHLRAEKGALPTDPSRVDDAVTTSALVVSPTICFHCFRVHRGRTLSTADRLFTAVGNCGRKEPFVGPVDRLQLFTMREVIMFGSASEVEDERQRWMEIAWDLVTALDLTARFVVAFDPFFAQATKLKAYQQLLKAKYELQVKLPEEDRWCAVASFNAHGTSLTRAFNVKGPTETPLQSGCVGFGYERLLVAAVAQRGPAWGALGDALAAFGAG
jgi:hypothetical protein